MPAHFSLPDFTPRIHSVDFPELPGCRVWLLRDDEAPMTLPGGKLRKYRNLIPDLLKQGYKRAYIAGGRNSNNLVGLAQCLISVGIKPIPVLPTAFPGSEKGFNEFLLDLLVEDSQWKILDRHEWSQVDTIADEWAKTDTADGIKSFYIPEGCFLPEGITGSMELSKIIAAPRVDIPRFDHLLMEAGTGCSAIGLLLGGIQHPIPKVEILLLAEGKDKFHERLQQASIWLDIPESKLPEEGKDFQLHERRKGRFGKLATSDKEIIRNWAKRFGIFMDPVYTPPLLQAAMQWASEDKIGGNVLIVLSGGAHSLAGFTAKFNTK